MPILQSIDSSLMEALNSRPSLALEQSHETQLALAQVLAAPKAVLNILVEQAEEDIADIARQHINWAGELDAESWPSEIDAVLSRTELGQNDRLAVELLRWGPVPSEFLSEWVPARYFLQALKQPELPLRYRLKFLERLADEPNLEPRLQVAESPETPAAVLVQLLGDMEWPVRLAARHHSACPEEAIEQFQEAEAIAKDWETPADTLAELTQSVWPWIRFRVAQNPAADAATLMDLAEEKLHPIRLAVAQNPNAPDSVLAALMDNGQGEIEKAIAAHPNATPTMLLQLLKTQEYTVLQRKELPAAVLQRLFEEVGTDKDKTKAGIQARYHFLRQPNTPESILAALADCDVEAIKSRLMEKRSQPVDPKQLEKWVRNELNYLVDVAKHPNVSVAILQRLAQYSHPDVQLAVALHALTPEPLQLSLLEQLIAHGKHLAKISRHPSTPVSILEKLAEQELYQPKLLREIRRILSAEYPENCNSFVGTEDYIMSCLKHEVLSPLGHSVDVDLWMTVIESPDLLSKLEAGASQSDLRSDLWEQRLNFRLGEILPELEQETISKIADTLLEILGLANTYQSQDDNARQAAVRLVGNPRTPTEWQETLKRQLRRPNRSLDSQNSDCRLLAEIVFHPKTSESERAECIAQLMSVNQGKYQLAKDPRTPIVLLERILEETLGQNRDFDILEKLAENPSISEQLLHRLVDTKSDSLWRTIARYSSASAEVLLRMVHEPSENPVHSSTSTTECVIQHANFPLLERYRYELSQAELAAETQANSVLARRPNSPYALAQVVERGDQKAKLAAARNPQTPVATLQALATDSDEIVRRVVTENSNLPLSTRLEMMSDKSIGVRLNLARNRHKYIAPLEILTGLANDKDERVRAQVAQNPETPIDILEKLSHDSSSSVCETITRNQNATKSMLETIAKDKGIVAAYSKNTPEIAFRIAIEKTLKLDFRIRDKKLDNILKGHNSNIPSDILEQLADYKTSWVRSSVAFHHNTPPHALARLACDEYNPVRWGVAGNPNTSETTLQALFEKEDPKGSGYDSVCAYLIKRQHLPVPLMEALAKNPNAYTRQAIAKRSDLPQSLVEAMASTETQPEVLTALVSRYQLPGNTIDRLLDYELEQVNLSLVNRSNLTLQQWRQLAQSHSLKIRLAIAEKNETPIEILSLLVTNESVDVRCKLANRPLPEPMQTILVQDKEPNVRRIIATNPDLPTTKLEELARDATIEVRRAVAKNPNTPSSLREALQEEAPPVKSQAANPTLQSLPRLHNPQTGDLPAFLVDCMQSENAFVRFTTLQNPKAPQEILEQGARSQSWLERYAVAENPSTPAAIRLNLSQDGHRIVRAVALSQSSR